VIAAAGPPLAQGDVVVPDFGRGSNCVRENGTFCWAWFKDNWGDIFQPALVEHIWLTILAVGIGFLIAFTAALVAYRLGWFETPFTLLTGLLYTIPSLALFQLLVPITGLSVLTVEIALVSYTLLIVFRNTLLGLRNVPDEVREAARGMGLTRRQSLVRVELPLAMPAIMAGIRVATVTIISLATVAAFIVDEGLGSPIRDGLQKNFNTEFIAAGVLAVALALVADGLLVLLQRLLTPWARRSA
jgi:osmoprotectant transport system permease protein